MFNNSEILKSVSREGCILFEHQRETVASFLPSCSASHLPVFPFSINAIFILFIFCISICVVLDFYNYLMSVAKLIIYFDISSGIFDEMAFEDGKKQARKKNHCGSVIFSCGPGC